MTSNNIEEIIKKIKAARENLDSVEKLLASEPLPQAQPQPQPQHHTPAPVVKTPVVKAPIAKAPVTTAPVGLTGTFDGINMVTKDGKKYEVPLGYAAKSKLVSGDTLSMVEENGKNLFKQLDKVARVSKQGLVLQRSDGWFVVTDAGPFKLLEGVVEFNKLSDHTEVEVIIAKDSTGGYCALEKVLEEKPAPVKEAPKPQDSKIIEVDLPKKQPEKPATEEKKMTIAEYNPRVMTDFDLR